MDRPTIAVVLPAYQAGDTIAEALDSVLGQTVPPDELVVCDDGSTDDTQKVLGKYAPRLDLVTQSNQGAGAASNAAIERCSSEYIVRMDADDVWLPTRLERMIPSLAPDRIVTTNAIVHRPERPELVAYPGLVDPDFPRDNTGQRVEILRHNFIFAHAAFARRAWKRVGGYDEQLLRSEDRDLWMKLIYSGCTAVLIDEPLAIYRLRASGQNHDRVGTLTSNLVTIRRAPVSTPPERSVQAACVRAVSDQLEVATAQRAVRDGAPSRELCIRVARNPRHTPWVRFKALAAAVAPGVVRKVAPTPARPFD